MEKITFYIDNFEGPMDLLYHLIQKNKIDIYDIPISSLTEQYLKYIEKSNNKSMDSISEFILMASTLLEIKSKMLIPKNDKANTNINEENTDPRDELVKKLIEYKKFKKISEEFKKYEKEASLILYKKSIKIDDVLENKNNDISDINVLLDGITLNDIFNIFNDIMKRKDVKIDKVRSSFNSIEKDMYTIDEKINYIRDMLFIVPKLNFKSIFANTSKKIEIIITFLAILELIKMKEIIIYQNKLFDDIIIISKNNE